MHRSQASRHRLCLPHKAHSRIHSAVLETQSAMQGTHTHTYSSMSVTARHGHACTQVTALSATHLQKSSRQNEEWRKRRARPIPHLPLSLQGDLPWGLAGHCCVQATCGSGRDDHRKVHDEEAAQAAAAAAELLSLLPPSSPKGRPAHMFKGGE